VWSLRLLRSPARASDRRPPRGDIGAPAATQPQALRGARHTRGAPPRGARLGKTTLALGETHSALAVVPLRRAFARARHRDLLEAGALALALLRHPEATDALFEALETGSAEHAECAIDALGVFRFAPGIEERLQEALPRRGDERLARRWREKRERG
jgi:hypothetical protein